MGAALSGRPRAAGPGVPHARRDPRRLGLRDSRFAGPGRALLPRRVPGLRLHGRHRGGLGWRGRAQQRDPGPDRRPAAPGDRRAASLPAPDHARPGGLAAEALIAAGTRATRASRPAAAPARTSRPPPPPWTDPSRARTARAPRRAAPGDLARAADPPR